eukprot:TRINITY_DN178_c0_g1_i1.p1 TRINITY_DN178_c0_g1~~TRINITY_DN178_c0_g1_i1.p1  ORF type:complete len:100 (-),score=17.79 TRINITY_DN178_c0_g1_i1:158-457(-)
MDVELGEAVLTSCPLFGFSLLGSNTKAFSASLLLLGLFAGVKHGSLDSETSSAFLQGLGIVARLTLGGKSEALGSGGTDSSIVFLDFSLLSKMGKLLNS